MENAGLHEVLDLYTTLPRRQQERLAREISSTVTALDREIDRVLRPTVAPSASGYLVSDEVIPLYGVGGSPAEAKADYRSVVVEYYEDLEADAEELGPDLDRQREILRALFAALDPR